ncbi:spore germination protein [Tepidibacter formicigenes]|jgi:spore germination protein KA|uniref:Spore germination protein KA n=1 Tax=Tepidibacter formicigenes DSM 15518 TaxID=1123349 RepID=A0A1M6KZ17_9FIRM|nr:spore germination protein [Tepidibacter formicigenes]SHJ64082.1 spore germination protein KA [Tepidibacter formicigenes DSM 15518]
MKIFKQKSKIKNTNSNEYSNLKLSKSIEDNINMFKENLAGIETIKYRKLKNKKVNKFNYCIIYVDEMVKKEILNEYIMQPLMTQEIKKNNADEILEEIIFAAEASKEKNVNYLIDKILYGHVVILVDGIDEAISVSAQGWERRAITEPESEVVVRGPREGFTESISTNLGLIRRKVINSDLKLKFKTIGNCTKTKVCICYIESIASPKILKELEYRLDKIDIDGVLESGYIEELIKDEPLSPFKTIGHTERPDVVVANLLEGKIALVVDGTPVVLTLPFLFMEYFQSNEDYYNNFIYASINRIIRYIGFFLTTSIPAIYLALVTYHQEMIPTPLLIGISAAREGIPFPTIFEAMAMIFVFEVLREAGIMLPKPIGATISIVGALVLGEAAVNARFISAPMVIIIAMTGISSFLTPKMLGPTLIIRTIFLLLASFLGLYGYIFGVIGLFIHLMSIRSFGVPYMLNLGSIDTQDLKDTTIRAPWWYMHYRPKLIANKNLERKKNERR